VHESSLRGFWGATLWRSIVLPRISWVSGISLDGSGNAGNSAIDIALWDLYGKLVGQPIAQLLGGFSREKIRTYNTCAGAQYIREANDAGINNWGLGGSRQNGYDDLNGFLERADELATELLAEGITAMKIWPFDGAAPKFDGHYISKTDLKAALGPFEKIRKAVGDQMDIMVEFHSLWELLPAITIARALAPFETFWHEDPIRMDSLSSLVRYSQVSPAPICASETLGSRWAFRDLLETEAAGVIMLDLSWCGGLSEARKIAGMVETWHLPIALTTARDRWCCAPRRICRSMLQTPDSESVRPSTTLVPDLVTALPAWRTATSQCRRDRVWVGPGSRSRPTLHGHATSVGGRQVKKLKKKTLTKYTPFFSPPSL